ncbi:hypothetical protein OM302_12075 [Escherichia albertii]|uniref:hypothetical protein n=1 Tax=Escherichia albertii TaxID=208962 RepID=UPI0010BCAA7F|nr:hypothetical protein [Escherichia albertii]MCZ8594526.1 hypothetical protein [Escherichia albertii]MCZ8664670.1 hypothetical protein [Escherichia albertii]
MKTAKELMNEYGLDNIKAEIKHLPIHALVEKVTSLQDSKKNLYPGRTLDDQKLRAMAEEHEAIRISLQCLSDTGRFKGELPADLPAPDDYSNLFSWLVALKGDIEKRCPDSGFFTVPYSGFAYGEWHQHLATYHRDLPTLLTALAQRRQATDFSRANCLNPCYYADWQAAGEDAMNVLFTSNEEAAVESMLAKVEALAYIFPQPVQVKAALAVLRHCILSKDGAAKLVAGGFNAQAVEVISRLHYSMRVHGHTEVLAATVIEMNLSRISQAIKLAAEKAEQELKAALQRADRSAAFEARKAVARRKVALQQKLAEDKITSDELQELETL